MVDEREVKTAEEIIRRIVGNIETVVYGKTNVVELMLMALIANGHVLIEDVPGTGKTSLVSALAQSVACDFKRIQFTPDVMPSDITGFSVFNQQTRTFDFRPGGVMSNIVLADEINRASAKTQSALLEAMEERQVTVDAHTHRLEEPFMVLATQNPVEQYGTYPLPEAQVDRFLIKLSVGYPDHGQEVKMLKRPLEAKSSLGAVATGEDVMRLRQIATHVHVSEDVFNYIVEIVAATRTNPEIELGASPRGSLALVSLCRAYALVQGRGYVMPDDVKRMVPYALGHRITLDHDARVQGRSSEDVLASIVSSIAVPASANNE